MQNDKYEQLKTVIQKANPEIMELKFGCGIERRYGPYPRGKIIGEDNGTFYVLYDGINQEIETLYNIQESEILGRPIRLADVIYWQMFKTGANAHSGNRDKIIAKWNFLDDNLDHQSEETKQFLINLLT